jgi:hypothetical protein
MDARIEAEAMTMGAEAPVVIVRTSEKVDDLTVMVDSLFDAASVLALLTNQGNSITAVAPDYSNGRKESGLALVG